MDSNLLENPMIIKMELKMQMDALLWYLSDRVAVIPKSPRAAKKG